MGATGRSVLAVLVLLAFGGAGRAGAGPLLPGDFTPLGALDIHGGGGVYTFDTDADTLTGPGLSLVGVRSGGVSVFDFTSVTIDRAFPVIVGSHPLAVLSRGNLSITGDAGQSSIPGYVAFPSHLNLNGQDGGMVGGPGGPGGGTGGNGGGGFGGGRGGSGPNGDLTQTLVGGSGGVGGPLGGHFDTGGGGGGGGAVELAASGTLTITNSTIAAHGGRGGSNFPVPGGSRISGGSGGGGGGGGILLYAETVILGLNALDVSGGDGGGGLIGSGGGGGSGGQVVVLSNTLIDGPSSYILDGGGRGFGNPFGPPGSAGVLVLGSGPVAVPEPSALVQGVLGGFLLLGFARRRRRAARLRSRA